MRDVGRQAFVCCIANAPSKRVRAVSAPVSRDCYLHSHIFLGSLYVTLFDVPFSRSKSRDN